MNKAKLLIISHVLPYPGKAGQQRRVYYKLRAFREVFHTTFLTYAPPSQMAEVQENLWAYCDEPLVLPSVYSRNKASTLWYKLKSFVYAAHTGLKPSNHVIGDVEFALARLSEIAARGQYDMVVYEYWHAHKSTRVFQQHGTPCVLDMHDVLWQSRSRQLELNPGIPDWWKKRNIRLYKKAEEAAWHHFDALIAINRAEGDYAKKIVGDDTPIFYAPMGTDLTHWPYSQQILTPPRIAYYASLGSRHNQEDAMRCYEKIMPLVWREHPDAEFWIVGNNPPDFIRSIPEQDSRVTVTGFVEQVQDVLNTMSVVLCPWSGTYGFRSRLVEVMALGVPVVATPDAVYGMDMEHEKGIFLYDEDEELAGICISLLNNPEFAREQSRLARKQVEEKFSYEATYGKLASDLSVFCITSIPERTPPPPC